MTNQTIDALKEPEFTPVDFSAFTDDQIDAVVIYLAKIARETRTEHGMTKEQQEASIKKFFAIMDSWPKDFNQRVRSRIFDAAKDSEKARQPSFWVAPADAMILATRAIELA